MHKSCQLIGPAPEIPNFNSHESLVLERDENESYLISDRWMDHVIGFHVYFEPNEHVYIVDNRYMSRSVTEVLESYFGKFDADQTIKIMKNSTSNIWPRPEYSTVTACGIVKCFTDEQIKLKWAEDRNRGTWMHFNIERFLNGLQYSSDVAIEMEYFVNFYQKEIRGRGIIPYITEWRIASPEELCLGGSVDFVGKFEDGTYGIVDWKRIKNWDSLHSSFSRKCCGSLFELGASNYNKYSLQINLYRYILEKEYGIKVSWMAVASFHPNQSEYKFAVVDNMDNIINTIILDLKRAIE